MVYRVKFEDDEEGGSSGANRQFAGGSAEGGVSEEGAGGPSGVSNAAPRANKTTSGSFQNLMGFLNANQEQAQGLNEKVSGKIGEEVGQAQSALDTGKEGFRRDVDAGTVKLDQGLIDSTIARPTGDTSAIERQISGEYKGPQDFRGTDAYGNVQKEVGEVKSIADRGKTEAGRQSLIGETYAKPGKPTTQHKYDQFLMTKAPNFGQTQAALGQAEGYNTAVEDTVAELNPLAVAAGATSQETGEKTTEQLTAARDEIVSDVNRRVTEAVANGRLSQEQARAATEEGDAAALRTLGFTEDQIKDIGILIKQASLYGGEPSLANYLGTQHDPSAVYNADNVATTQEAARYQALNKLVNGTGNALDPSRIGDAAKNDVFGTQKYFDDLANTVLEGIQMDAAKTAVKNGQYSSVDDALKAIKKAELVGGVGTIASYASMGATLGSIVPGIGNVVGAIIGGAIGAIKSIFGGSSKSEKAYKAYDPQREGIQGRALSEKQFDRIGSQVMGRDLSPELETDIAKALGLQSGTKTGGKGAQIKQFDTGKASDGMSNWAKEAVNKAISDGIITGGNLAVYDSDRIFEKIVAPYINAKLAAAGGKSVVGPGGKLGQWLADMTDKVMYDMYQAMPKVPPPTTGPVRPGGPSAPAPTIPVPNTRVPGVSTPTRGLN